MKVNLAHFCTPWGLLMNGLSLLGVLQCIGLLHNLTIYNVRFCTHSQMFCIQSNQIPMSFFHNLDTIPILPTTQHTCTQSTQNPNVGHASNNSLPLIYINIPICLQNPNVGSLQLTWRWPFFVTTINKLMQVGPFRSSTYLNSG